VKWVDYKKHAKERGALALELFVAQSVPAKGPEDVKASLPDHLAYQARLEQMRIRCIKAVHGAIRCGAGWLMKGHSTWTLDYLQRLLVLP